MKGILLAGGTGSRLWPTTLGISKHLIPVYDKPLIYYPLSTLMISGIKEICLVSTPRDIENYESLLGSGSQFGIKLSYKVQERPEGIAQVFSIASDFIASSNVSLILGDNLFHGMGLGGKLAELQKLNGAHIFGYKVQNPEAYGVLEFNLDGSLRDIQEKPLKPMSKFAIPGIYFYDNSVIEISKSLKKSSRGEFEISDLNREYLKMGNLNYTLLERGTVWLDCGTPNSLLSASNYVRSIEERQGLKISSPEEIAWRQGWIDDSDLQRISREYGNDYGSYLSSLLEIR